MHLDLALDLACGNPPWGGRGIRRGEQYRSVDFMNHPAEAGHAAKAQMANLILHRRRRGPLEDEQVVGWSYSGRKASPSGRTISIRFGSSAPEPIDDCSHFRQAGQDIGEGRNRLAQALASQQPIDRDVKRFLQGEQVFRARIRGLVRLVDPLVERRQRDSGALDRLGLIEASLVQNLAQAVAGSLFLREILRLRCLTQISRLRYLSHIVEVRLSSEPWGFGPQPHRGGTLGGIFL